MSISALNQIRSNHSWQLNSGGVRKIITSGNILEHTKTRLDWSPFPCLGSPYEWCSWCSQAVLSGCGQWRLPRGVGCIKGENWNRNEQKHLSAHNLYIMLYKLICEAKSQAHRFPHNTISSDSISSRTETGKSKQAKHCIKINDDEFAAFLRSINWADSIAHLKNRTNQEKTGSRDKFRSRRLF